MVTTRSALIVLCILLCNPIRMFAADPSRGSDKPPNLLFIMTDQQRFDAVSIAGNAILQTPNMDRIAMEGAWFSNFYTQCAVCSPARATILTGCALENTKVITNDVYITESSGWMPMLTFDEILSKNGYTCEYYGKWHAPPYRGRIYQNSVHATKSTELGPSGKTAYLDYLDPLFPVRDLLPGEFYDTYTLRPYLATPIDLRYDLASRGEDTGDKPGQGDIHGVTSIPAEYHISAHEAAGAIEALERLKDSTFSLTCSFHHPHPPYLAAEKYYKMFPPESMPVPYSISDDMTDSPYLGVKRGQSPMYSDPEKVKYFVSEYYALVKEVDDRIGMILDKLDELGLTDNTLVIFTSDHGEMLGAHGMNSKMLFYEESSHVPMMIRFPGRIEPGKAVHNYVSNINLFATILDYLGLPPTPSDGFSLRGLIEGTDHENGKFVVTEWLSSLATRPSHMVIKDGWKLMIPDSSSTSAIKALYNLNEDPYEMDNLLVNNPDAARYEPIVRDLEYCYYLWLMDIRGIPVINSGSAPATGGDVVRVYPNPAYDTIQVDIPSFQTAVRFELSDMSGSLVMEQDHNMGSFSVRIDDFPEGMYLYKIMADRNFVSSGKILIQ